MAQNYDLQNTGPEVQERLDQVMPNKTDIEQEVLDRQAGDNDLQEQINTINAEIGEQSGGSETINGRLDTLEEAVGDGGSIDERIAAAEAEILGGASEDYNTLGKVEGELEDTYRKEETYTKQQVNDLITTPDVQYVSVVATDQTTAVTDLLPATGADDTIYRIGNWDGTQYDTTMYALYAWNGSAYVCLAVRSFVGEVYDISANHPDGQGNPTPYADLTAALAYVPNDIKSGGMQVKFIQGTEQSSDNKYVQFRLMAQSFTTDVTKWQGVDDEPTAGSENLVKSGGVFNASVLEIEKMKMDATIEEGAINIGDYNALVNVEATGTFQHVVLDVEEGEQYVIRGLGTSGTKYLLWATTIANSTSQYYKNRYSTNQDTVSDPYIITIQQGENHLIVNNQIANPNFSVYKITDSLQKQINDNTAAVECMDDVFGMSSDFVLLDNGVDLSHRVTNPTDMIVVNPDFKHLYLEVKHGERYAIKGRTLSDSILLWATTRVVGSWSNWVISRRAETFQEGKDFSIVTIQPGENHLFVNCNIKSFPNFRVYKLQDETVGHQYNIENGAIFQKLELCNNYSINTSGTNWAACASASDYACRVVPCKAGDKFRLSGTGASSARLWATADKNGDIQRVADVNYQSQSLYEVTIAEGETVFIFNTKTNVEIVPALYYYGSTDINTVRIASSADSSQADKDSAHYVFSSGAGKLTNFILTKGITLVFAQGTYDVASAIYYTNGSSIIGEGTVTFDRSNNVSAYVFLPIYSGVHDVIFKGISFNRRTYGISHPTAQVYNLTLENVSFVGSDYTINIVDALVINVPEEGNQHFTVGTGKNFPNLFQAYRYNRAQPSTKMCMYHIYGHSVITEFDNNSTLQGEQLVFAIPSYFIGETDDATVELLSNYKTPRFVAGYQTNNDPNRSVFRDIRFLRTGEIDAYNIDCFTVYSDHCKFYDCIFENQTKSPVAFDNDTDPYTPTNSINPHGDRRHGAFISNQLYDGDCELEFYNCKGIGSPYGFKNTRGWYITTGSARLYNCIGIGGGIGERGYGIICHRQSKPKLYNCIGYGSPYGARYCNGIQFQANAMPILYNCIGYGGTGYKWESDGTNYTQKSPAVLSKENHGFGVYLSPSPTMIDCTGYAGDGEGSSGILMRDYSKAKIVNCYFGKEQKIWYSYYTPDSGQTYMTIPLGNENRDIYLDDIYLADGENITYDGSLKVQVLAGGTVIAEKVWNTQELDVTISTPLVTANTVVIWRFIDVSTGYPVNLAEGQRAKLTVRWRVNNQMVCAIMQGSTKPNIFNTTFDGNENSDGIYVGNGTDGWLISNCTVKSTRKSVYASVDSPKSNVPIVDCVFTADTDNITSFKQASAVLSSTNVKI